MRTKVTDTYTEIDRQTHTYTETDKPIAIGEILQIFLKTTKVNFIFVQFVTVL